MTVEGKIVAILTMFCGLVVLSLPITIIGANFDDEFRELRKRNQEEKERVRRNERKQQRSLQQQQEHIAALKAGGTPSTPQAKAGDRGSVALTFPPDSPTHPGGPPNEDPIKLIQELIHEAHYALVQARPAILLARSAAV